MMKTLSAMVATIVIWLIYAVYGLNSLSWKKAERSGMRDRMKPQFI